VLPLMGHYRERSVYQGWRVVVSKEEAMRFLLGQRML
jgi:hypothetical protein